MGNASAEIALLISSFERPRHLECALTSIAMQQEAGDRLELVVTDDGSRDETIARVAKFAAQVSFPVKLTTHEHRAFQVARCRNEGALVSSAPYLLFSDGDCFLPRDHLAQHLRRRRPNVVMAGDCCRLSEELSGRFDGAAIARGDWCHFDLRAEERRLRRQHRKAQLYTLIGHATKPRLVGNNVGIWREDYVAVNGYDEQFVGWECEDDDLGMRLRRAGRTIQSVLKWTWTYHLWHPLAPSCPPRWRDGDNVGYLSSNRHRPIRCRQGLLDLDRQEASARKQADSPDARRPVRCPFAEVVFHPGQGMFSGQATWNVLVVEDSRILPIDRAAAAHLIISPDETPTLIKRLQFLNVHEEHRDMRRRNAVERAA